MYTYAIIDDDLFSNKLLQSTLEADVELIHKNSFSDSEVALKYLNENSVEIIFLDILMPKISGLQLRDKLKENIEVIFTTASSNYALQAFDGCVTDYLVKPIKDKELKRALQKAKINIDLRRKVELRSTPISEFQLTLKHNNKVHKVWASEILYVESKKEYLKYNINGMSIIDYGALYKLKNELQKNVFIQIHRSFIVNKNHIKQFNKKQITLSDNTILPIGKSYSDEVYNYLLEPNLD